MSKKNMPRMSKEEVRQLKWRLRYMSMENLVKDFPDARSRKAIAAVLKWLSHNAVCAVRMKGGNYRTNLRIGDDITKSDACVLDDDKFDQIISLFKEEYDALRKPPPAKKKKKK